MPYGVCLEIYREPSELGKTIWESIQNGNIYSCFGGVQYLPHPQITIFHIPMYRQTDQSQEWFSLYAEKS